MTTADIIVVGAGLVGSAVALGLAKQGAKVIILDEGDQVLRASRGNFGLVWVQGKGFGLSPYAAWSKKSANQWPELAELLLDKTGVDVVLQQNGGVSIALSNEDLEGKISNLRWIADDLDEEYCFEVLNHKELKELLPHIGDTIPGATYTKMDGHVNPLKLLVALHKVLKIMGVKLVSSNPVSSISFSDKQFTCKTKQGNFISEKVVLAAGLKNKDLGKFVGINAPVIPNRGQVLITERMPDWLDLPTNYVRQTDEGTIQLGDSLEDVGFNDWTETEVLAGIAQRAIRCFPILKDTKIIRSWAALRVMSPDGFPIYQESQACPGAYVVTCHSGVTLAANHVFTIAPWITSDIKPKEIVTFGSDRFENN